MAPDSITAADANASDELVAFRARVRQWLTANAPETAPASLPSTTAEEVDARSFAQKLYEAGLLGLTYPRDIGGQGLTAAHERVFAQESADFALPMALFTVGLGMCLPTIVQLGTDAQRARHVIPSLTGETVWCQLFSEPAAGSDIAGLRMRAVREDGGFRLNGQKVWTTSAHFADWGIVLARTDFDLPKHKGLTALMVDMRSPGLTIRPLRDMTGNSEFNEIFFDDVLVPHEDLLGEVNGGWVVATALLTHERLAVSTGVGDSGDNVDPLSHATLAAWLKDEGLTEPVLDELVGLYVRHRLADLLNARLSAEADAGREPGARGSMTKLLIAENQILAALSATRILGAEVAAAEDTVRTSKLYEALAGASKLAIGGGTNEIQRNIIAERVLGLPREPRSDTGPFRDAVAAEAAVRNGGA